METELCLDVVVCPRCRGGLDAQADGAHCAGCDSSYSQRDGFLDLFVPAEGEGELAAQVTAANEDYHNSVAGEYEEDSDTVEIFGDACQSRMRHVLEELAASSGRQLLIDVGCGTGNALQLGARIFDRAVGIDVATSMLRGAADRGLDALRGNAYRLPFADSSVNVVTAFAMLHHVEDIPGLLAEVHRVLVPGGALYSDWDPNSKLSYGLVRLARHPLIYHRAKAVYRALSGARKDDAYYHEAGIEETFRLAEFHAFGVSCDADRIADAAVATGFSPPTVRFHANPPDLETDDWARLPAKRRAVLRARGLLAGQLQRRKLLPLFLIIARKPGAAASTP